MTSSPFDLVGKEAPGHFHGVDYVKNLIKAGHLKYELYAR